MTEQDIHSFLPTKKILRILRDRRKYVDVPLFPSYLFIYLEDIQSYYKGMDAEGALYYVRTGKEIARVSESVVNNIRLLVDKGKEIEVSTDNFLPGQHLLIRQGPLTGLSCEMIQLSGRQKILVRVQLLQRNLLIALPPDQLMAATA